MYQRRSKTSEHIGERCIRGGEVCIQNGDINILAKIENGIELLERRFSKILNDRWGYKYISKSREWK